MIDYTKLELGDMLICTKPIYYFREGESYYVDIITPRTMTIAGKVGEKIVSHRFFLFDRHKTGDFEDYFICHKLERNRKIKECI